jgi:5-bromo-4-chloroindolyl phosphate hydrolysis protein
MDFLNNLASLIKVKTIVTIIVMSVFAVLALRGDISAEMSMMIVTNVIAFYFGTQHEKKAVLTN